MFLSKTVIIGLFSINFAWSQVLLNCGNDCVPINDCLEAKEYLSRPTPASLRALRLNMCGIANNRFSVCCYSLKMYSLFGPVRDIRATSIETTLKPDVKEHPNMKLLPDACGYIEHVRLHSEIASINEFPWMALISYATGNGLKFACSGTLINSQYILTAAHCVDVSYKIAGVRLGEHDIRSEHDCQNNVCYNNIQDIRVAEKIVHESYTGYPKYENDIALLRLASNIDLNCKKAGAICLPETQELRNSTIENKIGTVTGWGLSESNTGNSVLFKVDATVRSINECKEFYSQIPDPSNTQFCATQSSRNSCKGDSGGPLIIADNYKNSFKYVQYGIMSKGPSSCDSKTPSIYTDVRKYVDWILDHIRE